MTTQDRGRGHDGPLQPLRDQAHALPPMRPDARPPLAPRRLPHGRGPRHRGSHQLGASGAGASHPDECPALGAREDRGNGAVVQGEREAAPAARDATARAVRIDPTRIQRESMKVQDVPTVPAQGLQSVASEGHRDPNQSGKTTMLGSPLLAVKGGARLLFEPMPYPLHETCRRCERHKRYHGQSGECPPKGASRKHKDA